MRIAVAGGTGTIGTHVVEIAVERGHDVVVLSRSSGVDLVHDEGVAEALHGVDVVIDVANIATMNGREATEFFEVTTRVLLAAEAREGVRHHVTLSIVGIDGIDDGYYGAKLAQERAVQAGPIPWTIQRATQVHEFARQVYGGAKIGPVHLAPRMRTQPIAAREVAERLVDLAEAGPAGRVTDLAGPREESLVEIVRAYARTHGSHAWIPAVSLPGAMAKSQRDGSSLPAPGAIIGHQTYDEWLAESD
ncbi:SDR family oxidoreductase [Microbacterium sp. NPDC019599]|uniref:SDR family oxidoreductase n=1 Tax=Microbacterium sp. NPDC019599 TaxID=3154690 RepID=UPI0033E6E42B